MTCIRHNKSLILFFRNRENDFAQYQSGVMDASTWERHISAIQAIFSYERNRNWWRNYGSTALDREFVTEVNAVLEQTPVTQVQVQDIHRSFIEGPGGNSGGATQ